jgi:hypothetical protein
VVVEVRDEGPGVPEGREQLVFDQRASTEPSGLGLPLARTLVAADGGRLELLTARPAVFAMFLPTGAVEPAAEPVAEPGRVEGARTQPEEEPVDEPVEHDDGRVEDQTVVERVSSPAASVSSGNTQRR